MTRIDFYLLSEQGEGAVNAVCRLSEKAVAANKRIYVRVVDSAEAEQLDNALWTYSQGSFVAHERYHGDAVEPPAPPVLIGSVEAPATHHDILINLGDDVPPWFSSFERVLEVVDADPSRRTPSRERYRFYKDRGYELRTTEQTPDGGWKQRAA